MKRSKITEAHIVAILNTCKQVNCAERDQEVIDTLNDVVVRYQLCYSGSVTTASRLHIARRTSRKQNALLPVPLRARLSVLTDRKGSARARNRSRCFRRVIRHEAA